MGTVCSNSRRTNASSVHTVGGSTGGVGALLANGDSTALTRVDTMPDAIPTRVRVLTVAAGSAGGSCTAAAAASGTDIAAGMTAPIVDATGRVVDTDGCTPSATTRASRLLAAAVVSAAAVTPAEVRVPVAAVEPDAGPAVAIDRVLESARKVYGPLAFGVSAVAVVLADGELVCGPPVAATTSGAPERVLLPFPAGETEAAGPVRLDSAVDEVSPTELLTAIPPGGFSGLR